MPKNAKRNNLAVYFKLRKGRLINPVPSGDKANSPPFTSLLNNTLFKGGFYIMSIY